ncbi:hypothetical protein [Massilia sp. NR 4-1]|uniref:hypothetical protein n=1 Tax=Massilia sp. NR 4-1 TaxID=1678028 RepID=UPI00067BF004|nr:hypothetical protein [Massilia sp. NR 4-1]AKU20494.1 hypothetical protein ACZ75_02125 [Massilia sp. NR 4-1]
MSIQQMKTRVKAMMAERYGAPRGAIAESDNAAIAAAFFVRARDAAAIREVCSRSHYSISFRTAGEHTLTRLAQNNPCKGHKILDKSIKQKPDGSKSYANLADSDYLSLKGLVGYPNPDGSLGGLWSIDGKNSFKKVDLAAARTAASKAVFYTGDYDMHDLLKFSDGAYTRILAGTPDEASAIDAFNTAILKTEENARRKELVAASIAGVPNARLCSSEYALIRHGAQTSFFSYLLGPGGKEMPKPATNNSLPMEDAVNNIDPNICIFDANGKAFILNSVANIYKYYALNNLLDQIPFYYFFKDLRANPDYNRELNQFAADINGYIDSCGYREGA